VGSGVGVKDRADSLPFSVVARLEDTSDAVTRNDPNTTTTNNGMRFPELIKLSLRLSILLLLVE